MGFVMCRAGSYLGISGKRQRQGGHQLWVTIAAIGAWQWQRCSAEHVVPGSSGLWAPIAAADGETLPPPPQAPPAQQEPAPWSSALSATWCFPSLCLQVRNVSRGAGLFAAVAGDE